MEMAGDNRAEIKRVLTLVFETLREMGYDPIAQLTGYLLSGDYSYITGKNNARKQISRFEPDELLEEVLRSYYYGE